MISSSFQKLILAVVILNSWGFATTFTVTTIADTDDGVCDADCSLREALYEVERDDIVTFAPTLAGKTIVLTEALPNITTGNLTIDASGLAKPVIIARSTQEGIPKFRILSHRSPDTTFVVDSIIITNGDTEFVGGGIASQGRVIVKNSFIVGNRGSRGGGIYSEGGLISINNIVANNWATEFGGGIGSYDSSVLVVNSIVTSNRAPSGGGIANLHANVINTTVIKESEVLSNQVKISGGGVAVLSTNNSMDDPSAGYAAISGSRISGNTSDSDGGGIYSNVRTSVINTSITGNTADRLAGAVIAWANSERITFVNSTIVANRSQDFGPAVHVLPGISFTSSNTIVLGNTEDSYGEEIWLDEQSVSIQNSAFGLIADTTDLYKESYEQYFVIGETVEEVFVDPRLASDAPTIEGNYRLVAGSPAIDVGSQEFIPPITTDLDGNPRVHGSAVDMGAYEFIGD